MKNWWNSLSTIWKAVVIGVVLVVSIFIYDFFTGSISGVESWWNNKQYEQRMEKVEALEKENETLRAEKKEAERQAIEAKAREALFVPREENLTAREKKELQKLDEALAEQDREEAITALPTDKVTRCERTKQKMLDRGIQIAKEINCNE